MKVREYTEWRAEKTEDKWEQLVIWYWGHSTGRSPARGATPLSGSHRPHFARTPTLLYPHSCCRRSWAMLVCGSYSLHKTTFQGCPSHSSSRVSLLLLLVSTQPRPSELGSGPTSYRDPSLCSCMLSPPQTWVQRVSCRDWNPLCHDSAVCRPLWTVGSF